MKFPVLMITAALGLSACMTPTRDTSQPEVSRATVEMRNGFARITTRDEMVALVDGRRFVTPKGAWWLTKEGEMLGRFGDRRLKGTWDWDDGAWCRAYVSGTKVKERECQAVYHKGNEVMFVKDRGAGDESIQRLK